MDDVYAYLMASTWLFLIGWIVLLLVAGIVVFREKDESMASPFHNEPAICSAKVQQIPQRSASGRKVPST
jgi:hypothetical protein